MTTPTTTDHQRAEIIKQERERVDWIGQMGRMSGLEEIARRCIADGSTVEQTSEAFFSHMERVNPPIGAGRIVSGEYEGNRKDAMIDAIAIKSGARIEKPAAGADHFRHASVVDIARNALEHFGGMNTRSLSPSQVIKAAMTQRMATTSDFPSMLANAAGKTLRNAYEEAPATFQKWTVKGEASTFLEQSRVQLSNAPDMDPIAEAAEYTFGNFSDAAEKFSLGKYGKAQSLSWEALVNDDLGGFARAMKAFVLASKRNLNKAVYQKLIDSPQLSDTIELFHTDHNNYVSTGGIPAIETLSVGRAMMRKQTGPQADAPLNITPAFIIVPVSLETIADSLITTVMGHDSTGGAGQANPFHNRLEVITEPVLDLVSEAAWYLTADPRYFDTIEVAYLDGQEAPYLEEEWGFMTDSWRFKLRHVWGICVLDHRGLFKNDGE